MTSLHPFASVSAVRKMSQYREWIWFSKSCLPLLNCFCRDSCGQPTAWAPRAGWILGNAVIPWNDWASWPGVKEYIFTKSSAAKWLEQIANSVGRLNFTKPTHFILLLLACGRSSSANRIKWRAMPSFRWECCLNLLLPSSWHFKALFCTKPNSVTLSSPNERERVPG